MPGLRQRGGKDDLPQGFVLCHEAMSRRRFFQGHDAIYEHFEFSSLAQLQGPLKVFLTLGPQSAFHLQTLSARPPT